MLVKRPGRAVIAALSALIAVGGVSPNSAAAGVDDPPVVVDDASGLIIVTIKIPGREGGRNVTDEGVNLDPCWWVYDPTGNVVEVYSGDTYPSKQESLDPGVRWYGKHCDADGFGTDTTTRDATWVLVGGPPPPGVPPPPPAMLAALAVKYMQIPLPGVQTNPTPSALTNLPTWLWLDNASWSLPPGRLSLRGVSVTVIATPKYVEWDTGTGTTKRCNGQGRAYDIYAPEASQLTYCSWTYTASSAGQPGEKYHGTATSVWGIHWISTGGPTGPQQADLLPDIRRTTPFDLRVEEIQSVVTK